jgi:tetratricopeptide (TPR) repeat protein
MSYWEPLSSVALFVLLVGATLGVPVPVAAQAAPEPPVQAAREAARADRNAEAAALFKEALAAAPQLRRELLKEYADQLTYAGEALVAVPLYREVLGWELPDSEARQARLGLALALSWSDRPDEARVEYERVLATDRGSIEARLGRARVLSWMGLLDASRAGYQDVLAEDPANIEARRGLAQLQAWRGRHRDAAARLDSLLQAHPDDVDSLLIRAEVHEALGRPDLAWPVLERLLGLRPDHARGLELREELLRRARPATGLDVRRSTQADDLHIAVLALVHAVHPGRGRTTLEARYEQARYQQPRAGVAEVTVHRPGAAVRHRISERSELNAAGFLELIDPAGASDRHQALTWDAWLSAWPVDGVRVDVSSSRATFDNIRSLVAPVHATFFGASADLMPDHRTRFTARGSRGTFSDGNGRLWGQAEFEQRLRAEPQVLVGARATGMRFDEQLDAGYFNPGRYASAVVTVRAWHGWRQRTWAEAGGSYGRETSTPGGGRPLWNAEASLVHRLVPRAEVEARVSHFSSRQLFTLEEALDGGWARQTLRLALRVLW